jgi:diadenosine tetraphosphatase ApaH/serine/threonine PP2A family protein phosphatase
MRAVIISDIHANLEALDAVFSALESESFDRLLVLGDLVGYGGAPSEVMERLAAWPGPMDWIRGNHDKAVAGIDPAEDFNLLAQVSLRWTRQQLPESQLEVLRELPQGPIDIEGVGLLCPGWPYDEDTYLFSPLEAAMGFDFTPAPLVFFGHTHIACMFVQTADDVLGYGLEGAEGELELEESTRYMINPGSVGQPRDGDPRAAFLVFDGERRTVAWRRVEYDVAAAQRRIADAGLPQMLADRLAVGG